MLRKCRDVGTWDEMLIEIPECQKICWGSLTTSKCDDYLNFVGESKPETILIIFCFVNMIVLSIFGFYARRVVINYRNALQLFQVFMKEF